MWIFCPFNGPSTIKAGAFNYTFSRIGQHVGDWEHYTLRLSNFDGELWSVYFSEHSGGEWLDASELSSSTEISRSYMHQKAAMQVSLMRVATFRARQSWALEQGTIVQKAIIP
ncbi:UNVERIFIED_CONTAM: hypothetical protein Sradi_6518400 [Sesamum radiatum]|uniref:Uncharacterized protein n=1 Tax=Sesamum radiatum TaxID=300843 RepID=A0AAW2JYG7_SESRA